MAATITLSSVSLAADGLTLSGMIGGGSGSGYTPASGLTNYTITVGGVARQLQQSSLSGTAWTGIAYTPILSGATVQTIVGTGNLTDSGVNTAQTGTIAVTNNSTQTAAAVSAAAVSIPVGSLNGWRTAKAAHASSLVEIVCFGDSTTADSGANYSWLYQAKHDAILAGYTDAGRGMGDGEGGGASDTATRSGPDENLVCFTNRTGFAGGSDSYDFFPGNMFSSNTVGDTVTLQGRGNAIRLFYTQHNSRGQFTYALDGGATVTLDAYNASNLLTSVVVIPTSGGSGVHSLVITNIGRPLQAPLQTGMGYSSPGASGFSSGTYYYVITGVNASGETTAGAYQSVTIPNGPRAASGNVVNTGNFTSYNLYRATASGGPYQFIAAITRTAGTYTAFSDNNTATPGANPPTTSTAGLDPNTRDVHVLADFYKSAGLLWHKNAISGTTYGSFGFSGAYNNFPYEVSLGLTQVDNSTTADTRPPNRAPSLAMCALGINDQQGGAAYTSAFGNAVTKFITAAKAAAGNSNVVVIIPHYSRAGSPTTAKPYIDATKAACVSGGVPWLDFNVVLDISGFTGGGPHLGQAGYNYEGDYVWTNLLGLSGGALRRIGFNGGMSSLTGGISG